MNKKLVAVAAGTIGLAVVLGAFGAHGLRPRISAEHLEQWRTGVEYQFYHGLGALLVASLADRFGSRVTKRSVWLFLAGVVLFSGSLYLLSTRELTGLGGATALLGPLTPLGGVCFMFGWLHLLITTLSGTDRG